MVAASYAFATTPLRGNTNTWPACVGPNVALLRAVACALHDFEPASSKPAPGGFVEHFGDLGHQLLRRQNDKPWEIVCSRAFLWPKRGIDPHQRTTVCEVFPELVLAMGNTFDRCNATGPHYLCIVDGATTPIPLEPIHQVLMEGRVIQIHAEVTHSQLEDPCVGPPVLRGIDNMPRVAPLPLHLPIGSIMRGASGVTLLVKAQIP